ncbi:MAG: DUF3575 domain-containing protein [Duncaniella sp.]|nr:DUF3575 domain-containing protein [Duncaniella sp.]
MRRKIILMLILLAGIFTAPRTDAQEVALKTNLLYDATLTVNLGAEVELSPRWSFDLSGNLNTWTLSHGRRWKHWLVQPEARYWFCEPFGGHFVGVHGLGGQYNVGHLGFARDIMGYSFSRLKTHRYQGWFAGVGVAYGYSWLLGRHWNLEAEIGLGWLYTKYDVFECKGCGRKTGKNHQNYFGPTKAAINLVYVF